MGFSKLY